MLNRLGYGLALSALLLVGAGCASNGTEVEVNEDAVSGDAEVRIMNPETSVDETVDQLLMDADEEKVQQANMEKDADDAVSDTAELNLMMQGEYDLK